MGERKLLGTSSISKGFKTTIIRRVVKKLELEEGGILAYYEDENGRIYIEKG
jgi:hypothetical protein